MKKIKAKDIEIMAGSLLQKDIEYILPSICKVRESKSVDDKQLGSLWDLLSPSFQEALKNPSRHSRQEVFDCIGILLDEGIDEIFMKVHQHAQTTTGDILPEQCFLLDELKNRLSMGIFKHAIGNGSTAESIFKGETCQKLVSLIKEQTLQNIPDHLIVKDGEQKDRSFKKR